MSAVTPVATVWVRHRSDDMPPAQRATALLQDSDQVSGRRAGELEDLRVQISTALNEGRRVLYDGHPLEWSRSVQRMVAMRAEGGRQRLLPWHRVYRALLDIEPATDDYAEAVEAECLRERKRAERAERAEAQLSVMLADAMTVKAAVGLPGNYVSPGGVSRAGIIEQAVERLLGTAVAVQGGRA